mmetsp:Transcript_11112/g.24481  ORF Transcript_11112/g.24481 Transcript_11112/m.24481 type:complete len:305 (+) Transcript_11112:319-1233(+)|eukprot:CAMPEP_0172327272 /NCGR_PEP_ID=MMETSP1058-20130122/59114_1 /TAXON_ID=83371 /ORGANISM="Detonula confervacea, Strain CCMP 353" /LENGTH=304 /DNA_ID=CAMNT_0013044277 /DNA_START=295 /DNA_END=1209 /DNA_ORIENTATION=-
MSNFFAALDDSDTEGRNAAPAITKKKAPKKEVVEPSKVEKRPVKNDRHTAGGRGRGGRAPARDGKRAYDRKSGTGRGKEVKKGGGGGHNWGSDQNDAKKAEGPVTEGKEDANTPEVKEKEVVVAAVVEEPEPEPVDNTISYDDYVASKARPDSAAFKALESRDIENEFAGKAASKYEEKEFLVMGGAKQPKKKGTGKKEKEILVLDFKIKSAITEDKGAGRDRDRGERGEGRGGRGGGDRGRRDGGRGGDRGGRGGGDRGRGGGDRGGDRGRRDGGRDRGSRSGGGRGAGKGLDTTDASAFPSL